ncbi:glutaminase A [Fusobacteria bacterium ZRK30]|nr:glutaminase A [Fusobacteria bacterium ZRK30]
MEILLDKIVKKNKIKTKFGNVANYIPGLDKAEKEDLGICLLDMDGNRYFYGDYDKKFTIQSVSKPIALMLAMLDNGVDYVFSKVGTEPTGDAFNSMIRLETAIIKKPYNPMINAGAIAVSSMIKGENKEEKFERLLDFFKLVTENDTLTYNEEIYSGENRTGNKNRAMAYFMKDQGVIESSVEESLDVYFKQCSIEVTTMDLAMVGMFLARNGRLSTGEKIISDYEAKVVKSLMMTCGMYDGSGEFALKVGIPSKSGVGGGIMSVLPNKMGIGIYGPALDKKGNSIGGDGILEDLSKELDLSIF